MSTITLLTDFGHIDTYVGQMKGVIATIAPQVTVIDLTHAVPPQQVLVAAVMLDAAVEAFAAATIHVAVVDPDVGSVRRAVAVRTEQGVLVGPDNGLFTAVLQRWPAVEVVVLTNRRYQRKTVSATFHGRDIFAPAAAHLAAGVPLHDLGEPVDPATLVRLNLPQPTPTTQGMTLHVLWIDHFGNLITDLRPSQWPDGKPTLTLHGHRIEGVARTFADVDEGEPVAYFGSSGRLEVAVRNGSAAQRWGAAVGDAVELVVR